MSARVEIRSYWHHPTMRELLDALQVLGGRVASKQPDWVLHDPGKEGKAFGWEFQIRGHSGGVTRLVAELVAVNDAAMREERRRVAKVLERKPWRVLGDALDGGGRAHV